MPYSKPDITVTQIFEDIAAAAITPNLLPAVAGDVYQVEVKASAGTYFGSAADYNYPGKKSGAVIDTSTYAPKAYVQMEGTDYEVTDKSGVVIDATDVSLPADLEETIAAQSTTGAHSVKVFTDANATFITDGVRAGDFVKISTSKYEVGSVDSETQLTLLVTPSETAPHTYTVVRNLLGTVRISYRAARTDSAVIGEYLEIGSLDDLKDLFGTDAITTPENPLGYGMYLAYAAGNCRVGGAGVDANESAASQYSACLDLFKRRRHAYFLVPLTLNRTYQDLFISHANGMSTPAKKKERRVYIARPMLENETLATGSDGATDTDGDTFTSASSTLQTDGVKAGDKITIGTEDEGVIKAVDSETQCTLETAVTGDLTGQTFILKRYYSTAQMVENARAVAFGLGNMRVTLLGPDQVTLDGTAVDSFYLAAIKAGMRAGAQIGQPLINASVPMITAVNKGSDYFDEDQLDEIAGAGWQLAVQDAAGAPCYIRDELTTDQSVGPKKGQESEVIARDYAAYSYRDTLRPQVGNFNVTARTLKILQASVQAVNLTLMSLPYQPFTGLTIEKFAASTSDPGKVECRVKATQSDPYTGMDIEFVV